MYKIHINFSVIINMSHKKSISINPSFFKIGGKANKKKKKEKPKMKNSLKPNDIKKKLIAKIKAHQKKSLLHKQLPLHHKHEVNWHGNKNKKLSQAKHTHN